MINNLKKSDTWNFQLAIANIFTSFDEEEEHVIMMKSMSCIQQCTEKEVFH